VFKSNLILLRVTSALGSEMGNSSSELWMNNDRLVVYTDSMLQCVYSE